MKQLMFRLHLKNRVRYRIINRFKVLLIDLIGYHLGIHVGEPFRYQLMRRIEREL